jgi:hypothetical protein
MKGQKNRVRANANFANRINVIGLSSVDASSRWRRQWSAPIVTITRAGADCVLQIA